MSLSVEIKEFALNLGFCKAGITAAEDFSPAIVELTPENSYCGYLSNNPSRLADSVRAKQLMGTAKSIIVTAFDHAQKSCPQESLSAIGQSYLSKNFPHAPHMIDNKRARLLKELWGKNGCMINTDMYVPVMESAYLSESRPSVSHMINGERVRLLKAFLEKRGCTVNTGAYSPIPQAARVDGKNNEASADGANSSIVLYAFIVDKELEYDAPGLEWVLIKG